MKKRSFLNKFVLIVGLFFAGQAFAAWSGDYSQVEAPTKVNDYYEIYNENQLAWFSDKTAGDNTTEKVKLMADLDMGGFPFVPICAGDGGPKYSGVFDGNGHTIKNLYINSDSAVTVPLKTSKNNRNKYAQNVGFIATLSGTIRNIVFENVLIEASQDYGKIIANKDNPISVGAVVGWMPGGKVDGVQVSGVISTSGTGQGVGSVVGYSEGSASISNCYSEADIQTSGEEVYVGGISGYAKGSVSISSVVFNGTVENSGTENASAGVVGQIASGTLTVKNCYYDSTAVSSGVAVGTPSGSTSGTDNLNSEDVVCTLNGGTWNKTTSTCTDETSDIWSVGQSDISINGSDGFKVIFNANGGSFASGAKTSKIVAKGASITASEIGEPAYSGYFFAGWNLSADATEAGDLGTATAKDTIYAVWDAGYTVTFRSTMGKFADSSSVKTIQVAKGGTVSIDSVPGKYVDAEGAKYYFVGWSNVQKEAYDAEYVLSDADTLHLASISLTSDIALYAVWSKAETYTVTFNANGHGSTDVQFVVVTKEDKVTEPNLTADEGYLVAGWYESQDGSGDAYVFGSTISQNLVLYAKWNLQSYTITYELDGGTNGANPSTYTIKTENKALVDPTKEGHTFGGWYYDAAFTNKATQISTGTKGNITLYAKWTPITYTVKYLSGNTIPGVVSNDTKEYGVALTLKDSVSTFSHGGCTQKGWSLSDNGEVAYAFGGEYKGNADLTLYPHWECSTYNLTYETDGGNKGNNPDTYTGPAMLGLNNGSYSGFYFGGWYREISFKNQVSNVQNITTDLTLYARWYNKVTYKPGSALSGVDSVVTNKNKGVYVTLKTSINKYVRDGYKLVGWSTSDGGDVEYALGARYETNANITLYPCWAAYPVTVATYGAVTIKENQDGTTTAVIDGDYTGTDATEITSDVTVDAVTFNREFTAGARSTIMLPFTIPVSKITGGVFYKVAKIGKDAEGKWTVGVSEADTLLANRPYIVEVAAGGPLSFDLKGEPVTLNTSTMNPSQVREDGFDWEFRGTYSKIVFGDSAETILGRAYGFVATAVEGFSVGQFAKAGPKAWIRPMRGYLVYGQSNSGAKSGSLNGAALEELPDEIQVKILDQQGNVQEVGMLNTVTGEIRMENWFDLKGRQLKSKPTAKGSYFHNGRRVMVK